MPPLPFALASAIGGVLSSVIVALALYIKSLHDARTTELKEANRQLAASNQALSQATAAMSARRLSSPPTELASNHRRDINGRY